MKKIINIYKKYEEIINYIIAGGLTTFISLITYYACVILFLDPNDPLKLQILLPFGILTIRLNIWIAVIPSL